MFPKTPFLTTKCITLSSELGNLKVTGASYTWHTHDSGAVSYSRKAESSSGVTSPCLTFNSVYLQEEALGLVVGVSVSLMPL